MRPNYYKLYIANADEVFADLLSLEWLDVTEARREYFMSGVSRKYTYGKGVGERTYDSKDYSPTVLGIQNKLNAEFGTDYNVCFLNRYDSQKQHLGWHADDSPEMDKSHPIAVLSFGAEREIWWKLQEATGVIPPENRQVLHHGSLFVMPAGFQEKYYHRIPKSDRTCGTRISLTFRKYKT